MFGTSKAELKQRILDLEQREADLARRVRNSQRLYSDMDDKLNEAFDIGYQAAMKYVLEHPECLTEAREAAKNDL